MPSLVGHFARPKNRSGPPVPVTSRAYRRGLTFDLGSGRGSREGYLRTYSRNGTVFAIVSLLQQAPASVRWHLYHKAAEPAPRYASRGDSGSDQRRENTRHAAVKLWESPNEFHSRFEFNEGSNQHLELTGETFWVVNREVTSFPTALWYVRPDRMEPVPDPQDYLVGWVYTGPNGEQVPLKRDEVILEKLPDPLDPFRGVGPVAGILDNIQQQEYAIQFQRNLFLNGADPGGIITVPSKLSDRDFDELVMRWREMHQGIARAGRVGILEAGAEWTPAGQTNKDLEYGNLRLANRDELREAWRIHKAMLGTSTEVNKANAVTAEEIFANWQTLPRLERRRDTLNRKLLPMFGAGTEDAYEFDFDSPVPPNIEQKNAELLTKASSAQTLIAAGFDADDVLEVVGLPDMTWTAPAQPPKPDDALRANPGRSLTGMAREAYTLQGSWNTDRPAQDAADLIAQVTAKKDPAAKAFEQEASDYPPEAMAWMHHATWAGPVRVPLAHVEPMMKWLDKADPKHVSEFVAVLRKGKKLKPLLLVKTPGSDKLLLVDGHHRYLAEREWAKETGEPAAARALIGVVDKDHGPWETMHDHQIDNAKRHGGASNLMPYGDAEHAAALLRRILGDGYVPVETGGAHASRG